MIVSKTPLRISFFGGGSDVPEYYEHSPGMVISTTIDKYVYVTANRCEPNHIKATYSETELVDDVSELRHDRIRETLKFFEIKNNIEIASHSDITSKGSGLGSSSSFTVGLYNALKGLKNEHPSSSNELARNAYYIERHLCGDKIGKQDQYAAAYGGFNVIRFDKDEVKYRKLDVGGMFQNNLFVYHTGIQRSAALVLETQIAKTQTYAGKNILKKMVDLTNDAVEAFTNGNYNYIGHALNKTWELKKSLSRDISNPVIDDLYNNGIKAGALGGKLLGAGAGGYMLFYVPENNHEKFQSEMQFCNRLHFKFETEGAKAYKI